MHSRLDKVRRTLTAVLTAVLSRGEALGMPRLQLGASSRGSSPRRNRRAMRLAIDRGKLWQPSPCPAKAQLVIRKAVRQSAHLAPGDVLSVRCVDGEIRLKPVAAVMPSSLAGVAGCLAKSGQKPLSQARTQTAIKARLQARFKVADAAP